MTDTQLAASTPRTLSADVLEITDVVNRKQLVNQIVQSTFIKDVHYGKIPGCGDKYNLLKPGAEVLCIYFRLAHRFVKEERDHENMHREFAFSSEVTHLGTGLFIAQGFGSCSTFESKYRFRSDIIKGEDGYPKPVPSAWWKSHDPTLLGDPSLSVKKVEGGWHVVRLIEHGNAADYWNTCLKMAKKRCYVDGTITATGSGDIFTQDMDGNGDDDEKTEKKTRARAPRQSAAEQAASERAANRPGDNFPKNYPAKAPAESASPESVSVTGLIEKAGKGKDRFECYVGDALFHCPLSDEELGNWLIESEGTSEVDVVGKATAKDEYEIVMIKLAK